MDELEQSDEEKGKRKHRIMKGTCRPLEHY
jgi:hypothetical protein